MNDGRWTSREILSDRPSTISTGVSSWERTPIPNRTDRVQILAPLLRSIADNATQSRTIERVLSYGLIPRIWPSDVNLYHRMSIDVRFPCNLVCNSGGLCNRIATKDG